MQGDFISADIMGGGFECQPLGFRQPPTAGRLIPFEGGGRQGRHGALREPFDILSKPVRA